MTQKPTNTTKPPPPLPKATFDAFLKKAIETPKLENKKPQKDKKAEVKK